MTEQVDLIPPQPEDFMEAVVVALAPVFKEHNVGPLLTVQTFADLIAATTIRGVEDEDKKRVDDEVEKLMDFLLRSLDLYQSKNQVGAGIETMALASIISYIARLFQEPELPEGDGDNGGGTETT